MRRSALRSALPVAASVAAATSLLSFLGGQQARAEQLFGVREVNPSAYVVVAAPVGTSGKKAHLNIFEQVNANKRACFSINGSNPAIVSPLLNNFDFTGVCSRFIDSVGYSIRIGSDDLFRTYRPVVRKTPTDVLLVASGGSGSPDMLIGRTYGTGGPVEFLEFKLEPGWRLVRRVREGRVLGHVYLYRDGWPTAASAAAPALAPAAVVAPVQPRPAPLAAVIAPPPAVPANPVAAPAATKPAAVAKSTGTPMAKAAMALYAPSVSIACTPLSGVPTTAARDFGKTIPLMTWYPSSFDRAGWTPQQRCDTVSQKLDEIRQRGELNYLTTGTVARQSVICAVDKPSALCNSRNMIMSLEKDQNPAETLLALVQLQPTDQGVTLVSKGKVLVNVPQVMEQRLHSLPQG